MPEGHHAVLVEEHAPPLRLEPGAELTARRAAAARHVAAAVPGTPAAHEALDVLASP